MSGDDVARRLLQERLLDDVELPSDAVREAMFERTFASPPDAGQDLLTPEGFFDPVPDDPGADGFDGDGNAGAGAPFADDGGLEPGEQGGLELAPDSGDGSDHGRDHGSDQGGDGGDDGDHGDHADGPGTDHPATDW